MTKRTIKILDEECQIAFNMKVQIAYERITGSPFDLNELHMAHNRIALYYSAIIANNESTSITIEDLMEKASRHEITAIDTAIGECVRDWYDVPQIAEQHVPEESNKEEEGDSSKN